MLLSNKQTNPGENVISFAEVKNVGSKAHLNRTCLTIESKRKHLKSIIFCLDWENVNRRWQIKSLTFSVLQQTTVRANIANRRKHEPVLNFPRWDRPTELIQECLDDPSTRSQKNPEEQLNHCRPGILHKWIKSWENCICISLGYLFLVSKSVWWMKYLKEIREQMYDESKWFFFPLYYKHPTEKP